MHPFPPHLLRGPPPALQVLDGGEHQLPPAARLGRGRGRGRRAPPSPPLVLLLPPPLLPLPPPILPPLPTSAPSLPGPPPLPLLLPAPPSPPQEEGEEGEAAGEGGGAPEPHAMGHWPSWLPGRGGSEAAGPPGAARPQWAQIGGIEVFFISEQRCGYLQKLHYVSFNLKDLVSS